MPLSESQLTALYLQLLSLSVYRQVLTQPVTSALLNLLKAAGDRDLAGLSRQWGHLCHLLAQRQSLQNLAAAVAEEVLEDDNPFTLALAAAGEDGPSPALTQAALRDLQILGQAAALTPEDVQTEGLPPMPWWETGRAGEPLSVPAGWANRLPELARYHRQHGYGQFIRYKAFYWGKGGLQPIPHPDNIRLHDLKEYAYQREVAVANTRALLQGLEANNILFYGDRGTGKSSTVKALLNEFAGEGLRMVEVPKACLADLPLLTARLAKSPLKFIVFVDDLSFHTNDDTFAALKAVLEGGLSARPRNVVIYATSNRRHLLKESFSDRQGDDIHQADTLQESVSLADRFGITLTYTLPDKQRFLKIVEQMAQDKGLTVDRETLLKGAEQWAVERGGRSPRYAKQYILALAAREQGGQP